MVFDHEYYSTYWFPDSLSVNGPRKFRCTLSSGIPAWWFVRLGMSSSCFCDILHKCQHMTYNLWTWLDRKKDFENFCNVFSIHFVELTNYHHRRHHVVEHAAVLFQACLLIDLNLFWWHSQIQTYCLSSWVCVAVHDMCIHVILNTLPTSWITGLLLTIVYCDLQTIEGMLITVKPQVLLGGASL